MVSRNRHWAGGTDNGELIADPFESAKKLLSWAWEDIESYASKWHDWVASKPYETFTEVDAQTGDHLLKARLLEPLPSGLSKMVNIAGGCIKHSFDQALYAAVRATCPSWDKQVNFPWADSPEGFAVRLEAIRRKVGSTFPAGIENILRELQPYNTGSDHSGGDDILRQFSALINNGKHYVSVDTYHAYQAQSVKIRVTSPGADVQIGGSLGMHDGALLLGRANNATFGERFEPVFDIVFDEPGALSRRPIFGVLEHVAYKADALISALDGFVTSHPA